MRHFRTLPVSTVLPLTSLTAAFWGLPTPPALAQIVPDRTLGDESSVVTPGGLIDEVESDRIDGGAIRGSQLFHSFEEFNVQSGRGVYFSNPEGIANIFSRVTGNNASNILGTLGVLGDANLFLINPNGIIFGPEAQLNLGGSFYGSTAESLLFENNVEFSSSDPQAPPLLTINVPIGLRLPENPAEIRVAGPDPAIDTGTADPLTGLQTSSGQTLALIGGDILIDGGSLTAESGRIELGSVRGGVVGLGADLAAPPDYQGAIAFGDIRLSREATLLNVGGDGAADIQIRGRNVELLEGSTISAGTSGPAGGTVSVGAETLQVRDGSQIRTFALGEGDGADLSITATDVELSGTSAEGSSGGLLTLAGAEAAGNGGSVSVETERLRILDGAQIVTNTLGPGNGGDVSIAAIDIELAGVSAGGVSSSLNALVGGEGNGGSLNIETKTLRILDGAEISTGTLGPGNGGSLNVTTETLQILDGAQILTSTFGEGPGGDVSIAAIDIELVGTSADGTFGGLNVQVGGRGNGGTLNVETETLRILDGAQINTFTNGEGDAGDVSIAATDMELVGTSVAGSAGGVSALVEADATGTGGTLSVDTERLRVLDGAQIRAGTVGRGSVGDVFIRAIDVELGGTASVSGSPSEISTFVGSGGVGDGGTLRIDTERLSVRDGTTIAADIFGRGTGGNLIITARDIELVGTSANGQFPSSLDVSLQTGAVGNAGTLRIDTETLGLRDGAQISTGTSGWGNGGNLTVTARDIELSGTSADGELSSSLSASVEPGAVGNGGTLRIDTETLRLRDGAQISTGTFSFGSGGNLTVTARDIELSGTSADGNVSSALAASVNPEGVGNGGTLRIDADTLRLRDGAQILTSTFGIGNGGNLTVTAADIELVGTSADGEASSSLGALVQSGAVGNGGTLRIDTETLRLRDGAQISTATAGQGNGGNLTVTARDIELSGTAAVGEAVSSLSASVQPNGVGNGGILRIDTETLRLRDGAIVSVSTFGQGDGGDLTIAATDVELSGSSADGGGGVFASVNPGAVGNGGNLSIDTETLRVFDGGQIGVSTFGGGDAGNLTVTARDIELVGTTPDGQFSSGLFASTNREATGRGGTLAIAAETLRVFDEAQITVGTSGEGDAGDLFISAAAIELRDSVIGASVERDGVGNGGTLIVDAGTLQVFDGAQIGARTFGGGDAGSLTVTAGEIELVGTTPDGQFSSGLFAETDSEATGRGGTLTINADRLIVRDGATIRVRSENTAPAGNLAIDVPSITLDNRASLDAQTAGGQGNIVINTEDLILRNQSDITTNATGTATGGNITIDTENLVALENSDISANAEDAFGGRIAIDALGIFGTQFRDRQSDRSDITATSELGPDFSGEVNLNTPDVDPSAGLVEFDTTIEDISSLIDQNPCQQGRGSEFTITGQGGLRPTPRDPLSPGSLWEDSRTPINPETVIPPESEFIEAQGWVKTPEGIQLIVNPDTATPARPWLIPPDCKQLETRYPTPYLTASTAFVAQASTSEPLTVTIEDFNFEGNTAFSDEELKEQLKPYLGKPITFAELIAARTAIAQFYTANNYITSGALIPPQTVSENGTVTVKVVEGKVGEINVTVEGRLNESYIKSRLERGISAPLNQDKLLEALQLLQLDPLVENISAELSAGVRPDTSILDVEVVTDDDWEIEAIANNGRVPSVGSFRRGVGLGYGNLTGMGDRFNLAYANTDGSNTVDAFYSIPVNSRNGRIELSYRRQDNRVVEWPFERLDIESDSNTYEIAFRQPIVQTPRQEFSLGLAATRRDSQTSILGTNYPLSEGANDDGETNLSILRFFQEYQRRGDNQVFAAYSEFNLGLGIFGATVNSNEPDSRFFYWRGQGQWVRRLAEDTLFVVGADLQLSASNLVPKERFSLGGYRSVRGYRQDTRLSDSGAFGTVEVRLPIPGISGEDTLFQIVPFVDAGIGWNSDGEEVPGPNGLASVGLGLQASLWDTINLRLDYGIPLVDVNSRDRTWQEGGFYFSVFSAPF